MTIPGRRSRRSSSLSDVGDRGRGDGRVLRRFRRKPHQDGGHCGHAEQALRIEQSRQKKCCLARPHVVHPFCRCGGRSSVYGEMSNLCRWFPGRQVAVCRRREDADHGQQRGRRAHLRQPDGSLPSHAPAVGLRFPRHHRRSLFRDDAARRLSCCIQVAGGIGRIHRFGQDSDRIGHEIDVNFRDLKQNRNKKTDSAKYGRNGS